jgi:hypothetical protein
MGEQLPAIWRIVLGFILAPIIPALVVGLLAAGGQDLVHALGFAAFLGIFYGIAPGLVLGIPAFLVLRNVVKPGIWACVSTGAAIASVGPILAALSMGLGLLVLVPIASVPLGALGGLTFWFVVLRGLNAEQQAPGSSPATPN